ncbi:unnamed protein product [Microthlaspi erraticum]|uniref:RNase H type-1 domain-containing protein n=1 Tax=Microthlaspi erraticum TaxID=1685480 RepID=A0A6D2IHU0_9BRAS|nr:unnamed protein product [Microthlaspi erraticum]
MLCFKIPVSLCKRIQSALTRFWWDQTPDVQKMSWSSWTKMTKPKSSGGLGFRDIQSFNDELLAKLSWRILKNPTCLLARVLKGKYCNDYNFLDVPTSTSSSHGWRGVLIGRDLLVEQLGKAIGDGQTTSLWNDSWLSHTSPIRPLGPPNLHDKDAKVASLINGTEWNKEKIEEMLPHHLPMIMKIRPSRRGAQDDYIWLPSKSGEGLFDNVCCVHCGELETTEHLFFRCEFAQKVWSLAPFGKSLDLTTISFEASVKFLKRLVCLPPTGISSGPLFPWICWTIWSARNYRIFEDRIFTPEDTNLKSIQDAREWQEAQDLEKKPHQATPRATNQRTLHPDTVICFTDGAWKQETAIAGAGWIFTSREGSNLDSGSLAEPFVSSPLMAEAIAIRSALIQALEKNFLHLQIKSDAQDLIRALTSQEKIKEIYGLLFDIQSLAKLFTSISFRFVPRSENREADFLQNRLHAISHPV